MKVVDNGKGDGSEVLGTTKEEVIVSGDDAEYIYKLVSGALANKSFVSDGAKYDTTLTLGLAIKNLDIAFTNSRTYVLSGDELAEYTNMDDVDRFTLSETIDITTQFKAGKENDIDLSAVLKAFLPSLTDEQLLVIKAQADDGGDVNRSVQLVVDADIQIAALLNYMRTELVKYAGDDDQFDGDMDLFTVLELLKKVIENIKSSELVNLIADIASYVNLSVRLQTKGGNDSEYHDMLGIYMVGGTFTLLTDEERNNVYSEHYVDPSERYDHYFETKNGSYYLAEDGTYKYISASEFAGTRYSYDSSYCYKNEKGNYKRENGGLFVDLSYFNIPSLRIDANEIRKLVSSIFAATSQEAMTAADDNNGNGEEDKKDKISFPLVKDDSILGYIRTFAYGLQITSRYVKVLAQADYINSILSLVMGENAIQFDADEFKNQSNVTLYTDNTRYSYAQANVVVDEFKSSVAGLDKSSAEYKKLAKDLKNTLTKSKYLFDITEYSGVGAQNKGVYYKDADGAYVQKSEMSQVEREAYDKKVVAGTASYYDIKKVEVFVKLQNGGAYVLYADATQTQINNCEKVEELKNDYLIRVPKLYFKNASGEYEAVNFTYWLVTPLKSRNEFISINLYLWNHKVSLAINAPKVGVTKFNYVTGEDAMRNHDISNIASGARYVNTNEDIYTSVDKATDGTDNWVFDYYTAGTFDTAKYAASPRYYEYKSKYVPIDEDTLFVKDAAGKYQKAAASAAELPDYIGEMEKGNAEYYVWTGTAYVRIQRTFIYKKYTYNTEKKVLLAHDDVKGDDQYFVKVQQESSVKQPDFSDAKYADYQYKEYVDTDNLYYISLTLSGRLFLEAGKIYLPYDVYEELYKSLHGGVAPTEDVIKSIAYKKFQGDYVKLAATDNISTLKANGGLYLWVNSTLDDKYNGVNEALGDVLGNILGAMKGKFQIAEDMTFNIYFSIRLNLGFKLYILPSFSIDVRDLDVAIDVWGEQNDLLENGNYVTSADRDENKYEGKLLDGTKPHILGIYYDNDKDTSKAGLYIDAEALLGKDAKLFVDMSEYPLEDVLTGIVGKAIQGDASDASVASDEVTDKNPDKQSSASTSLFLNIFTNAIAINVTSGFAKVLLAELLPDSASIADMLPNLKVYIKQNLNPYDITIGAILFNEKGDVPMFDLGLNIQGLNGVAGESSSIDFGRKEDILAMQQGSNAIFYYASFYRDNDNNDYTNYYGKNFQNKDYVRLYKGVDGNEYYAKENGGYDLSDNGDGTYTATENASGKYAIYKSNDGSIAGPEDRYMLATPVYSEVVKARQYAYDGIVYTDVDGIYMPVHERLNDIAGNNNVKNSSYRELVKTNQFTTFTGTLYIVDSNSNYVKTTKDNLQGFTGEGNLQYKKLADGTYEAIDANGNGYTDMEEADTYTGTVYKKVTDFTNYTKALSLNLGDLLGGGEFDVTSVLAGLDSVELGANLNIKMTLDDVINWTYQFTKFIGSDQIAEYLYFVATSLKNNKEFESFIGLNVDLKAYLKLANLVKMIAGDKSVGILQALEGAKIYLELTYVTNFHGDAQPKALLWVEIREGKLYVNLDASEIGDIVGWGDFFSYGVIEGLDLSSILGSSATTASAQASVAAMAADEEVNTGMIPANIWSVLNVVLGRLLIANDFITVGLNETLIADLIGMLADSDSAVLQGIGEFLPKLRTTDTKDTSGITINFYGNSPSVDINLGFKVGTLVYETVANFNAMYGEKGKYFKGSNWSGTTFTKDSNGNYTVGSGADNDTYVLMSTDDYALVAYAYPAWDGDTYDYVAASNTFVKHEGAGKGAYLKQGDFAIAISLGKLYATVNKDFSVDKDSKFADKNADGTIKYVESATGKYVKDGEIYRLATEADKDLTHYAASYSNYVRLQNATAHLEMSIDVSLYGSGKAGDANIIDLSEILDMIMGLISPDSAISGSTLKLNIVNEFGNDKEAFLTLDLAANIDVNTFKVELALELNKNAKGTSGTTVSKKLLGVYLIDNALYVDLSGILGNTAKIAVTDLNLDGLLEGVLGKFLNTEDTSATGASTASKSDITTIEQTMKDYAYFMINVTPQKLLLQLNADLINAIYKKVMQIRGLDSTKNLIPDIGDLLLKMDASETGAKKYVKFASAAEKESYAGKTYNKIGIRYVEATDGTKGDYYQDSTSTRTMFSLNLRFSDGLYFCLDIPAPEITKDISTGIATQFGVTKSDYIEILSLDLNSLIGGTGTFDISSLKLPTIGLSASLELTMTSKNLKPGDEGYSDSLAGWVISLFENLLGGQSMFGKFTALTLNNGALYDGGTQYEGKVYVKNGDAYELYTGTTYSASTTYYKYTLADINITMASEAINFTIDIAANINLAPILAYGIGGILFSDIAVDIKAGDPINSTILSLYYLGSSRLMKQSDGRWELGAATSPVYTENEIYSDAIYIDATGLGLGKIKFQGIAGLLGATPSYDAAIASGASVSSDATTSDADASAEAKAAAGNALYLQVDIENGRLGMSFDSAFISTLIGMLGIDLGNITLPPIKSVKLDINLGESGFESINLNAQLDSVGTGANVAIKNVSLGFGESKVDSEKLINSVKTGYAGLTFSKTSGLMSLVQNAIDNLKPGLNIEIQNKVWQLRQARNVSTAYDHSTITLNGRKVLTATNLKEYTDSDRNYNIRLDLKSNNAQTGLSAIVGGNNIFVTNLSLPTGGLVGAIVPLISALNCLDLGGMMGSSPLLKLVSGTDGDDSTYEYPSAKTAADTSTQVASGWNADKTSYSYPVKLDNLIKSVDVNLFNDHEYWPYFNGATAVSSGAGKISLKVKLNKDAYNELMIMVSCILMGLMKDKIDGDDGEPYFGDINKVGSGGSGLSKYLIDGIGDTDEITKFYNGLDALVQANASTQQKVNYVEPFMRSLPVTLTKWALMFALDAAKVSLPWGTIQSLASEIVQDLNKLIGGILPIPFASGEIDPSINIYIDLNPTASEYGLSSDKTVKPGIQAIEIKVNGEKNGIGTAMKYNRAKTTDKNNMKTVAGGGGAVAAGSSNSTTTDINEAWDFFMIRITPYSFNESSFTSGMLQFDDSESAANIGVEPPTEIVIEDPATRKGYAVSGGARKDFELRDSFFFDATLFPQKATVNFPIWIEDRQMTSYNAGSQYQDATGTYIVWDAASVDLTAANSETADENGRRLAGYVYGYALNTVLYAIPVYVTNDKELQTVKGFYRNNDGSYSEKALGVDIDTESSKYMAELPDLVRIAFSSGKYTFGTYMTDSLGNMAYAVINPISGAPSENGYQILTQPTQAEIDKGATANLNKDGNKYVLYPAYIAGLVTESKDGKDVYKTITVGDATYYVLDRSKLPTGRQFPAGTIEWNTDDFKYDWQGSTSWKSGDESNVVKVGFTYQWGLGKAVEDTIALTAKNYKISRLTSMSTSKDSSAPQVSFKSERDSNGNYTTIFEIDSMSVDASTQDLVAYLNSFKYVNGKFVTESSMTGYDVEWDTTELAKAIDAIKQDGKVNFYKGIDVTVKAKVGGERFSIFTSVTKNLTTTDKVGFIGKSETYVGKFAQEVNVRIVVKPFVFDSMVSEVTFDQYQYSTITAESLGNSYQIYVKDASGNKVAKTLSVGSALQVEAPFIKAGETYYDAYNNGVHKLTSDEITFNGYSNSRSYPLYVKLTIGTEFSGKQEVYVPLAVNALSPSTLNVTVSHEDTLNPTWVESEEHERYQVSFGSATHTMYPDWSTVTYYTNAACTKVKAEQNIFDGGTIYAQVEARVKDADGKDLALVNTGKTDENGNAIYEAQKITLRLSVEQQTVKSVNFFYDESIGDLASYIRVNGMTAELKAKLADKNNYTGSVYQQTHVIDGEAFGIDPINFAQNRSDYFKMSDWGDVANGTPVLVNLVKGDSYIAYVRAFESVVSDANYNGISQTIYALIGNNKVAINVNIPSYAFTGGKLTDSESKLTTLGGRVAGEGAEVLSLGYNVYDEWKLPASANVQTAEGKGAIDVAIKWIDYAAPSKDEIVTDESGSYVERKYFFFDGLAIRYPQADGFTARIYLDGFNAAADIVPDGMSNEYDVFDKFTFATTATVTVDGTTYHKVPLHWLDTSMPTAEEIKNGSFTRKAYVLGNYVAGNDITFDYTVTINNDFTLDGISGSYKEGFATDLTADNFYKGLLKSTTLRVNGKEIPVTLAWSNDYTAQSGYNGEMTLTITSMDGDKVALSSNVVANVTVAMTGIEGLANGQSYRLDPYAKASTLFANGSVQKVKVAGSEVLQDVRVEYNFDNEEFYANISKYFGKKYKVAVTYRYNAGAHEQTETGEIEVYVVDRTIMYMSDYENRSIVVDTFLHKDASYLANVMRITTVNGDTFDAFFDWSDVDKLIKSGTSNTAYMATAVIGIERADGGYVKADITGSGIQSYVTIEDYVDFMKRDNKDFKLTDEARYMLAKQRVNVPVTVLDRTIVDAELMLDGTGLEYLYTESKYSTVTDTLVGMNGGVADGRYIDIVYTKATGMPEEYVYYNHFAYAGADRLPSRMTLTFANGDKGNYFISYENAPTARDLANLSATLDRKMTVHVWDSEEKNFEVMPSFEMTIKIRVSKVTLTNSDLAYNDMSVGSYKYNKDVYTDSENSVYNTANYDKTATFYVGAQFVTAYAWWNEGKEAIGANQYDYNTTYKKRHGFTDTDGTTYPGIYKVYGGFENEKDYAGVKFYVYNQDTKNYALFDGDVSTIGENFKTSDGKDLYLLVYVTTQTLNVSWNAQDVKYTFRGGNVAVEATLTGGVKDNDASAKVDVTVHINNSRTESATLVTGNGDALFKNGEFVIDPYLNANVFARKSGYSGDRYEKSSTAIGGYVKNNLDGTYKLVNGEYVAMTAAELDRDYVNFPTKLNVTLANGATVELPVTWDFSGVNVTYAGGEYTAYAIVNYGGEYNYGTNEVGTQRIRFTVRVLDRSVVSIADESALKALVGYANGTNSGVEQYVNPYEYVKPTMPTELKFNERTGNGDATQVVTYTTKDTNHLLVWSFDEFRPSYNGGLIYVTAKLIGMDGNVQSYKIPFLVKRMLANNMTSAKTTKNSSGKTVLTTTSVYNSAVENSVAKQHSASIPTIPQD